MPPRMVKPSIIIRELRAEFLPASAMAVFLGAAAAHARTGAFDLLLFALTLAGVVFIHLGTNVVNDYFDHRSGNDSFNTEFVRPFTGGGRIAIVAKAAVLPSAISRVEGDYFFMTSHLREMYTRPVSVRRSRRMEEQS
jgi:1,4-dihydroxy-2-naphthoate octaprenyltransferase